ALAQLKAAGLLLTGNDRDPNRAVEITAAALPSLQSMRSARVLDEVSDLRKAAAPYRRRSDIADLDGELRQLIA
ncbi:MAG: hypothetical protein J2P17_18090, partial [Mycobacterium sp.]|nr:hypothetical protein [Mycobacterium sp.]